VKPRSKQDLIRVNISYPCDFLLVHQQGFQPAPARSRKLSELISGHRQRVVSESPPAVMIQLPDVQQV
jgi:hypothetical protein